MPLVWFSRLRTRISSAAPGVVSRNSGRYVTTRSSRSTAPRSTCWSMSVAVRTFVTDPMRNPVSSSIGAPVAAFATPWETTAWSPPWWTPAR